MKSHKHLTIVIKLGTSSIVHEKTHEPLLSILSLIVETAVRLVKDGHRVAIVSSGAIGMGLRRMDVAKRPKSLTARQALASVGQCQLIGLWNTLFGHLHQPIAQILLTRNDIADRTQYLNAQNTFTELFGMGVIPIVNENDTIAVSVGPLSLLNGHQQELNVGQEIRAIEKFGDNDTLSAITAAMLQADYLFLMTDVDCLYDKNPRMHADARPIEVVEDISALEADVSSAGSTLGTGGMSTKIVAARLAGSAGVTTVISRSSNPNNILAIVSYVQARRTATESPSQRTATEPPSQRTAAEPSSQRTTTEPPSSSLPTTPAAEESDLSKSTSSLQLSGILRAPPLHTRFLPDPMPIRDRSFWLLHGIAPHGTIYIDQGAHRALTAKAALLPVGVIDVEGQFAQQEAVRLVVTQRPGHVRERNSRDVDGSAVSSEIESPPTEIGRALVNYSSAEILRIKGCQSTEIQSILGFADSEYVAVRQNISLLKTQKGRPATPGLVWP